MKKATLPILLSLAFVAPGCVTNATEDDDTEASQKDDDDSDRDTDDAGADPTDDDDTKGGDDDAPDGGALTDDDDSKTDDDNSDDRDSDDADAGSAGDDGDTYDSGTDTDAEASADSTDEDEDEDDSESNEADSGTSPATPAPRCDPSDNEDDITSTGSPTVSWSDSFEEGFGDWSIEGGVWAIGEPDYENGPAPATGSKLAGTNLQGDYEESQEARLVSPQLTIDGSENPRFKIAYWHQLNLNDYGQFQVSVNGGEWEDLSDAPFVGDSGGWGQRVIPLRDYDGQRVRIGILLKTRNHTGSSSADVAAGIYVDDAAFETGEMNLDKDDFEGGLGDWSVEGGVWAIGEPAEDVGPSPLSGDRVMGTNLAGNYIDDTGGISSDPNLNTHARLVSPEILVDDACANPRFKIAYWHQLNLNDRGQFQVSVDGGEWTNLQDDPFVGDSGGWGQRVVPLRDYGGHRVRIGILLETRNHTGSSSADVAAGIYVDDAAFETGEMNLDKDDFEGGLGDWSVEGGVWAIGEPAEDVGPSPLSGDRVMGTNLAGNYIDDTGGIGSDPNLNTHARLVSPEMFIDPSYDNPRFRIAVWHDLNLNDTGQFQLSIDGGAWEDFPSDEMTGSSGGWGQKVVELGEHSGHRVRVGLILRTENNTGSSSADVAPGIYVDDASFVAD